MQLLGVISRSRFVSANDIFAGQADLLHRKARRAVHAPMMIG